MGSGRIDWSHCLCTPAVRTGRRERRAFSFRECRAPRSWRNSLSGCCGTGECRKSRRRIRPGRQESGAGGDQAGAIRGGSDGEHVLEQLPVVLSIVGTGRLHIFILHGFGLPFSNIRKDGKRRLSGLLWLVFAGRLQVYGRILEIWLKCPSRRARWRGGPA